MRPSTSNAKSKSEIDKEKNKNTLQHGLVYKNKTKKECSAKKSPNDILNNHLISHSDAFNSSPSSCEDKLSDTSSYVVISETESCASERVSPRNNGVLQNISPNSKAFNSIEKSSPNKKRVSSNILSPSHTISSPTVLPYQSEFSTTLSNIELLCDSDINPLIESTRADTILESSNASSESTISDEMKPLDNFKLVVTENYDTVNCSKSPSHDLMPEKLFQSLINTLNLTGDAKEDFLCNELGAEPIIKYAGFNLKENDTFMSAYNISIYKGASNYIKQNLSRRKSFADTTPNDLENGCQDSLMQSNILPQLSENCLDFNESDCNQFNLEDTGSEISMCRTDDIEPEFFEGTFSILENLESDCSMDIAANEECCTTSIISNETNTLDSIEDVLIETKCTSTLNENDIIEKHPIPKPTKKRKRKRRYGVYSRKRYCKKKKPNLDNRVEDLTCDTCDESELDEPISEDPISSNLPSNDLQVEKSDKDIKVKDCLESKRIMTRNRGETRKNQYCKKKNTNLDNTEDLTCDTCDESELVEPPSNFISSECSSNLEKSNDRLEIKSDNCDKAENIYVSNCQESKQNIKKSNKKYKKNMNVSHETLSHACDEIDDTEDISVNNNMIIESSKKNKPCGKNLKLLAKYEESVTPDKNLKGSAPAMKRKRNKIKNNPSEIDMNTALHSSTSENCIDPRPDEEFDNTKPKKRKVYKNKNSTDNIKCSLPLKNLSIDSNITDSNTRVLSVKLTRLSKLTLDKISDNGSNQSTNEISQKKLISNNGSDQFANEISQQKTCANNGTAFQESINVNVDENLSSEASLLKSRSGIKISKPKKQSVTEKINFKSTGTIYEIKSVVTEPQAKNLYEGSSTPNLSPSKSDSYEIKPKKDKLLDVSTKVTKTSKRLKAAAKKNALTLISEKDKSENVPSSENLEMHLRTDMCLLPPDDSNSGSVKSKSPKLLRTENVSEITDCKKNSAQLVFDTGKEIPSDIALPVSKSSTEIFESSNTTIVSHSEPHIAKQKKSTVAFEDKILNR